MTFMMNLIAFRCKSKQRVNENGIDARIWNKIAKKVATTEQPCNAIMQMIVLN